METCCGFWDTISVIRVAHERAFLLESVQIGQYRDQEAMATGAELSYSLHEGLWTFPSLQRHQWEQQGRATWLQGE